MDDFVELPAAQASKASFPPGCPVWIHSFDGNELARSPRNYTVREGVVESIYLADVFSASRRFYYKVDISGGGAGTELVSETSIAFANNAPILFSDDCGEERSGDLPASREMAKGEVLTSMWSVNESGGATVIYSIIVSKCTEIAVKHEVRPGQLRFRPGGQAKMPVVHQIIGNFNNSAPLTNSKPKSAPPPGFATIKGAASISKSTPDSLLNQKRLQIPSWLVSSDSSRSEIIETLTGSFPNIYECTGCNILIQEDELNFKGQVWITVTERAEQGKGVKKAIEMVENKLVEMLGGDEARGRLLYDMAVSYCHVKPDGAVLTRNPLNSLERVWMYIVDLPAEIHEGNMTYIMSPFVDGKTHDSLHKANCTLKLCRESFGVKMSRCRPYALVFGKQAMNVSNAIVITKNSLKEFMQMKMAQNHSMSNKVVPVSRWDCMPSSSAASKKATPKSKIITIPQWLMSDATFQQQIEDGLFGYDWCLQNEIGEKTGCVILLSQNHLIVTPKHNEENKPSITKAIERIENALVGILGAQESKCKLLYDITESYSQVGLDGIIQLRNPLNSSERVWASLVALPVFVNKEGIKRYNLQPFVSKHTEIEMHRLKCAVKICGDNFNIKLKHCEPYAMIFGRQKYSVGKAIEFVKKTTKKCQREWETRMNHMENELEMNAHAS